MNINRSFLFWSVVVAQVAMFNVAIYALRLGLWPLAALFLAALVGANIWALGRLRNRW